jgi:hypothetical protein
MILLFTVGESQHQVTTIDTRVAGPFRSTVPSLTLA